MLAGMILFTVIGFFVQSVAVRGDRQDGLVERLRDGDEDAFSELVEQYHPALTRFAGVFLDDESAIEEIVQETWLAFVDGLERFEGRASIKSWLFGILANQAKKRANKDNRTKTWTSLFDDSSLADEYSRDDDRFDASGRWVEGPSRWELDPETQMMKQQLLEVIRDAIEQLPASQKAVVTLRDVEGLSAEQACEILEITDGNQRVLLHRGRVKVRDAVSEYLKTGARNESGTI